MKHLFLINPAAGKHDRTKEFSEIIHTLCRERGLDYEIRVSEKPGDICAFARHAAGYGEEVRIYACGGDGTLNEAVNGIAGFPNAAVTHFPGGSGNDTIKMFSETEPFRDLSRLLDAEETRMDLIRCGDTYSLNILSIGFDAKVGTDILRFKRLPLVSGKGAYILSILANMLGGLSEHYVVDINGHTYDEKQTMICVCNGRWYGGGFNPVPDAQPDDGLLDVLLVKKVGLLKAARLIGKYQKGEYRQLPEYIRHEQCTRLRIRCDKPSVVNVDGEAIWTDDAQIELLPKAIRFFYPKGLTFSCQPE